MRTPLLPLLLAAASLSLAGCADDPGGGSHSSVYHPVGEGRAPVAYQPPAGNAYPDAPAASTAPNTSPAPALSDPTPPIGPYVPSSPTVSDPAAPAAAAHPLDPAMHVVPPLGTPPAAGSGGPSLPPGAMAAGTSDADPYFKSFLGAEVPELPREGTWLNTGAVETLAGHRGQVVLVYFSFLKCGACPLMRPYLHHWHEAYGPKGFTIFYVDNGRADLLQEVKDSVALEGVRYPVFYDADGKAIAACGVRAFPTAYLIGKDGKVLWEGNPVGIESRVEDAIVKALP